MRLGFQPAQKHTQMVTTVLPAIERLDRSTLRRLAEIKTTHLYAGLLNVAIHHPTVTLGQPPQQDEQQLIIARDGSPAEPLWQVRPALQVQTPVECLAQ
jgi:hypothetical protein